MNIDPRLNDIDDCLYRVAIRVLVTHKSKVLLVKESSDDWWALPGGGVDHGESVESTLLREIEEELGVSAASVSCNFKIVHYNIGNIVNAVPRMNLYFKATIPIELLTLSPHVTQLKWLTQHEFINADLHPSYDKQTLKAIIW